MAKYAGFIALCAYQQDGLELIEAGKREPEMRISAASGCWNKKRRPCSRLFSPLQTRVCRIVLVRSWPVW